MPPYSPDPALHRTLGSSRRFQKSRSSLEMEPTGPPEDAACDSERPGWGDGLGTRAGCRRRCGSSKGDPTVNELIIRWGTPSAISADSLVSKCSVCITYSFCSKGFHQASMQIRQPSQSGRFRGRSEDDLFSHHSVCDCLERSHACYHESLVSYRVSWAGAECSLTHIVR